MHENLGQLTKTDMTHTLSSIGPLTGLGRKHNDILQRVFNYEKEKDANTKENDSYVVLS